MRAWKSLVAFLLLVAAAGAVGALAPADAWYAALAKPSFNPPAWVFAPVWTALYVLIAVAAWRAYVRRGFDAAIGLWLVQLACNAAWSPLFFGLHAIGLALADVVVLLALVAITTVAFMRRDRIAGMLMLPYLAWVAFATLLTIALFRLNA
jgi:benzodiazapine receptor